jgi:hypothetical protein
MKLFCFGFSTSRLRRLMKRPTLPPPGAKKPGSHSLPRVSGTSTPSRRRGLYCLVRPRSGHSVPLVGGRRFRHVTGRSTTSHCAPSGPDHLRRRDRGRPQRRGPRLEAAEAKEEPPARRLSPARSADPPFAGCGQEGTSGSPAVLKPSGTWLAPAADRRRFSPSSRPRGARFPARTGTRRTAASVRRGPSAPPCRSP